MEILDVIGVTNYGFRVLILVLYKNEEIIRVQPFYKSTGLNSKERGKWFPCFKIQEWGKHRGWIIKAAFNPSKKDNDLVLCEESRYIFPELEELSQILSDSFGNKVPRHEPNFDLTIEKVNELLDKKKDILIQKFKAK